MKKLLGSLVLAATDRIAVLLGLESGLSLTDPIVTIQLRRNMRTLESLSCLWKSHWLLVASLVLLPQLLFAQWTASVGAESGDQGRKALAFLPNEIWIHVCDSITWTLVTKIEPHTVTPDSEPDPQSLQRRLSRIHARQLALRWHGVRVDSTHGERSDLHRDFSRNR